MVVVVVVVVAVVVVVVVVVIATVMVVVVVVVAVVLITVLLALICFCLEGRRAFRLLGAEFGYSFSPKRPPLLGTGLRLPFREAEPCPQGGA